MTRYDFEDLYAAATRFEATAEDRINLYNWMESFDMDSWNGECFDLGNGRSIYPIYEEQDDDFILIDAEIR